MAKVIIAPSADADVSEIFAYLAEQAGLRTAAKYLERFDALYDHVTTYPESCPLRPRLGANVRIGIASPYIVIFRYSLASDTVLVLRVVHGRRRITGRLLRGINRKRD